jgi:serine/threonine-protein kinase
MSDFEPNIASTLAQAALPAPTLPLRHTCPEIVPRHVGKFECLCELGRGGMGVVFKARQTDLDRTIALKMLLPGAFANDDDVQRFRTEAQAAAGLSHPNIVRVFEVGEFDGRPFLSMEFIDGPTLSKRLLQGPIPGRVAARYLVAIARALQHAHEHGILHRDLKPANVLVDAADQPHVTDFGLAKRLGCDGQTRTGAVLGTPSYMSPEQVSGSKELTPATDVYGLGALLYELVTARPPFHAETAVDTLVHVLERDPAPPRLLNPNVDHDLQTICLKCLEKDPRHRYASASEVAEDLERYLNGESIRARSLNIFSRLAWSLEHHQYDVDFQPYAPMLFGFAAAILLVDIAKFVALQVGHSPFVFMTLNVARFALLMILFLWLRPHKGLRPSSSAERQLWSVWIGYVITVMVLGLAHLLLDRGWRAEHERVIFPSITAIAGLAFFAMGSHYWGGCYIIGLVFQAVALLMALIPDYAPLLHGCMWAACLSTVAWRLRRLGRTESARIGAARKT